MKIPNKKKNQRRAFFNQGKGTLCWCGGLMAMATNIFGDSPFLACSVPHRNQ